MKLKTFLALGLTPIFLNACNPTQPLLAPGANPALFRSAANSQLQPGRPSLRQNPQQLIDLLKRIYMEQLADGVKPGQPMPDVTQILEQNGPAMFKLLAQDPESRQALYPLADAAVIREFNQHSPTDNVPPISEAEQNDLLKRLLPGDVILCGNDKSFVHGALYLGNGEIVHSLATQPDSPTRFRGVVREPFKTYVARSERDTFVVLRYKGLNPTEFNRVAAYATRQVGKGYDSLFLYQTDERFYCTELLWASLRQLSRPPRVLPHMVKYGWEMVTVEDFMDSPDMETVWTRNYTRPPVGKLHRY